MQAPATLMPRVNLPPGASGCRPCSRYDGNTAPQTRPSPPATRAATAAAAAACSCGVVQPAPYPQSTMARAGRPSAASAPHAASSAEAAEAAGRTRWPSRLPVVCTMPATPCLETERKACGAEAALTASTAAAAEAAVAWNPTGVERPEASSRWAREPACRAPTRAYDARSATNCGVMVSTYSTAVGRPSLATSRSRRRAARKPEFMSTDPSSCGSVTSPAQPPPGAAAAASSAAAEERERFTDITTRSSDSSSAASAANRAAYSIASDGS
mmetsp:Transcript_4143/g.13311  ORF Transcript_4143/g.13311 Transcript_4143/m.13311 type:complete len:271 (-) Transcript_4143:332-1144(-)